MAKNGLIFSLLTVMLACAYPSWANDSSITVTQPPLMSKLASADITSLTSSTVQPSPSVADTAQTNNSSTGKTNQTTRASLPKKVLGVATALVIGTPVCIVRRTKYEEWYGVNGMIGTSDNKCKKVLAGIFWFPFAAICGTAEAPFDAVANGLMYPAFSKNQLSQGKLIQNN